MTEGLSNSDTYLSANIKSAPVNKRPTIVAFEKAAFGPLSR